MPDQQPEWIPLTSANLDAVQYDADAKTLRVRFNNGREYSYAMLPPDIAQGLIQSDSPGKFFNSFVKGAFPDEESF